MKRISFTVFLSCMLPMLLGVPLGACVEVTTVVGGETITWNLNVPQVASLGCPSTSDTRGCMYYFAAPVPHPQTSLTLSAAMTPTVWSSCSNTLDLIYAPYGDTLRVEEAGPPGVLANAREDLFFVPDPVPGQGFVKVYSIQYRRLIEGETVLLWYIDIYFYNQSSTEYRCPPGGGRRGGPFTAFIPPCGPGDPKKPFPFPPDPGGPGR